MAGVTGGEINTSVQVAQGSVGQAPDTGPSTEFLLKFGGKALGKRLEQEKAVAFVDAVSAVQAGVTVREIEQAQPEWAAVFGGTDVAATARAYAAQKGAAEFATAVEAQLPQLASESPERFKQLITEQVQARLGQGAEADALMMQSLGRVLPTVFDAHSKAHLRSVTEQALRLQSDAVSAEGRVVQSKFSRLAIEGASPDVYQAEASRFLGTFRRPAGQPLESWQKARSNDVLALLENEQFHAAFEFMDSPLFSQLTPEQRQQLSWRADTAQRQARNGISAEPIRNRLAEFETRLQASGYQIVPGGTVDQQIAAVRTHYEQINKEFRQLTGARRDMIEYSQYLPATAKHVRHAIEVAQQRAQHESDRMLALAGKAAQQEQRRADQLAAYLAGNGHGLQGEFDHDFNRQMLQSRVGPLLVADGPLADEGKRELSYLARWMGSGKSAEWVQKEATRQVADAMQVGNTDQLALAYTNYLRFKEAGVPVGQVYENPEILARMAALESMVGPNPIGQGTSSAVAAQALATAFSKERRPAAVKLSPKDIKAVIDEMKGTANWRSWWPLASGLSDESLQMLARDAEPIIGLYAGNMATESAIRAGIDSLRVSRGVHVAGDYFWYDRENVGQPLHALLRQGRKDTQIAADDEAASESVDRFVKHVVGGGKFASLQHVGGNKLLLSFWSDVRGQRTMISRHVTYGEIGDWAQANKPSVLGGTIGVTPTGGWRRDWRTDGRLVDRKPGTSGTTQEDMSQFGP